jgi:hypothetical protein
MTYSFSSDKFNLPSVPALDTLEDSRPEEQKHPFGEQKVHSLAALWARKYYVSVTNHDDEWELANAASLAELTSPVGLAYTANKVSQNLNLASAQAWSLTETLLSQEIRRHGINPELVNPLEIAADTRALFEKAFQAYTERATPAHLSVAVGRNIGQVRDKYTSVDPRAIGFVSMQFHYTGQKLLGFLSPIEQKLFAPYLKVMDDHMYMPLPAAYAAAAKHDYDSPALVAVRHLLPVSTQIAEQVCRRVAREHPNYQSYTGKLSNPQVKISSIRDVEMFQVYLCVCALEGSIRSVQRELFPLCVMLYPKLQVRWVLVQQMISLMSWEMKDRLTVDDVAIYLPYLRTFADMFSHQVFQG